MGTPNGIIHRALFSALFFLSVITLPSSAAWPYSPDRKLTARSAYLMNAADGRVLYKRRPDRPLPPASTTKIVTAIVALESNRLDERLSVTGNASQVPSLRIGMRPGQAMTVRDLLYSALLYSANDATVVLAEGISGSVPAFTKRMTSKARQLNALNSHFKNPHGLTATGHTSSAKDMALLFNYALKNPEFRKIVQTKRTTVGLIPAGKKRRVRRIPLRNKNRLLWNFNGAIGGKTGYTRAARRCYVGAATRSGVTLIVSILGSRSLWSDTRRLLNYGFRELAVKDRWIRAFFVQVASFWNQERAETLHARIVSEGYPASVESRILNNGRTIHRVRVGPYEKKTQARRTARILERKNGLKALVVSILSPDKPRSKSDL